MVCDLEIMKVALRPRIYIMIILEVLEDGVGEGQVSFCGYSGA
jgi:hypothetical protein